MITFLHRLWNSPLKGTLIALPSAIAVFVVNHLAGSTGVLPLPTTTAIDMLTLWGGSLFAVGGVAYSYYQALEDLKKEHEEEKVTFEKIDFRRGKRTLNRWVAACPKCGKPVEDAALPQAGRHDFAKVVACSAHCGWQIFEKRKVAEITRSLEELRP
jgi:hypothetical protein